MAEYQFTAADAVVMVIFAAVALGYLIVIMGGSDDDH